MANFKVGDMVKVIVGEDKLGLMNDLIKPNGVYKVVDVDEYGVKLKERYSSTWLNLDYVEHHVPTVKPSISSTSKPRTRILSSGKRQFDVTYKLNVVRKVREARRTGKRGDIKVILESYQIDNKRLQYWEKQHDQGHFAQGRAIAFSRQTTMIKG